MPNTDIVVMNTGPLLALIAACGDLSILSSLYHKVIVPFEVGQEILAGGSSNFAVAQFQEADWLQKWPTPLGLDPIFANSLDKGEAAVIQLALNEQIRTVCIDETVGRRVARLSGLLVTGSVGILLRAKQEGYPISMQNALQRMKARGVWLSERVVHFALTQADEIDNFES